jgi:Ca2+-binding EF-hand superfamily protein
MGAKHGKGGKYQEGIAIASKNLSDLNELDYQFLIHQTGQSREEIKQIFDKFSDNNRDLKLNKSEFAQLYMQLRPEAPETLDEISQFIFDAFDADKNGQIDFNEFMVNLNDSILITISKKLFDFWRFLKISYALTSRGDAKKKLEYAFALYDRDNNGYLDQREVRTVLLAMLDLLGADKRSHNVTMLTNECMKSLDTYQDGKITKGTRLLNVWNYKKKKRKVSIFWLN